MSFTGSEVARERICVSALSCSGSRCWTSTKPMPVSSGRDLSNCVNASSPPAEAPTPTIGNGPFSGCSPSRELAVSGNSVVAFGSPESVVFIGVFFPKADQGKSEGSRRFFHSQVPQWSGSWIHPRATCMGEEGIKVSCVDDKPDITTMLRLTIDLEPDMQGVGCFAQADHLLAE